LYLDFDNNNCKEDIKFETACVDLKGLTYLNLNLSRNNLD